MHICRSEVLVADGRIFGKGLGKSAKNGNFYIRFSSVKFGRILSIEKFYEHFSQENKKVPIEMDEIFFVAKLNKMSFIMTLRLSTICPIFCAQCILQLP